MIEQLGIKLKALGESAKGILIYIMLPVVGVISYIFYLKNKVTSLKQDLSISKAEKDFTKSLDKIEDLKKEAQDAEDDYRANRTKRDE